MNPRVLWTQDGVKRRHRRVACVLRMGRCLRTAVTAQRHRPVPRAHPACCEVPTGMTIPSPSACTCPWSHSVHPLCPRAQWALPPSRASHTCSPHPTPRACASHPHTCCLLSISVPGPRVSQAPPAPLRGAPVPSTPPAPSGSPSPLPSPFERGSRDSSHPWGCPPLIVPFPEF